VKVHWTHTAEEQLDSIYSYIALHSKEYAQRMVDRITRRSWQIGEFPLSGRKVPEFESDKIREIIEPPYRIIYLIKSDQVDIIAVLHTSMDPFRNGEKGLNEK
jgi:toxin ParE1/3/4